MASFGVTVVEKVARQFVVGHDCLVCERQSQRTTSIEDWHVLNCSTCRGEGPPLGNHPMGNETGGGSCGLLSQKTK